MWSVLKLIGSVIGSYRYYLMAAAIAGFIGTAYLHVRWDGTRDARLEAAVNLLHERNDAAIAYRATIADLNARIAETNQARQDDLAEAETRLAAARQVADLIHQRNETMQTEIGVLRFEILEGIRDDEDFSDWAYGPVHTNAWGLLRDAAEGPTTD